MIAPRWAWSSSSEATYAGAPMKHFVQIWSWFQRHDRIGLLVFAGALALYLPCAGSYGLWDPWETHYGEVARQMTTRGDFISLWWPGSPRETATFQTKPVLSFWLMSLAMRVAGIGAPDGPPGEMALGTAAEWAVRTPFCLMGAARAVGDLPGHFASGRAARRAAGRALHRHVSHVRAGCTPGDDRHGVRGPDEPGAGAGRPGAGAAARRQRHAAPPRWPPFACVGLFLLATVPQLLINSIDLRVTVPWRDRTRHDVRHRRHGAVLAGGGRADRVLAAHPRARTSSGCVPRPPWPGWRCWPRASPGWACRW